MGGGVGCGNSAATLPGTSIPDLCDASSIAAEQRFPPRAICQAQTPATTKGPSVSSRKKVPSPLMSYPEKQLMLSV